eukprot:GHVU01096290.1.p1 GENE.GHVU01096290.1~~GHVU01096290.1.p1  ORF type:complete len:402 (-),score=38.64 GHVU01096290.1:4288-5493(-)
MGHGAFLVTHKILTTSPERQQYQLHLVVAVSRGRALRINLRCNVWAPLLPRMRLLRDIEVLPDTRIGDVLVHQFSVLNESCRPCRVELVHVQETGAGSGGSPRFVGAEAARSPVAEEAGCGRYDKWSEAQQRGDCCLSVKAGTDVVAAGEAVQLFVTFAPKELRQYRASVLLRCVYEEEYAATKLAELEERVGSLPDEARHLDNGGSGVGRRTARAGPRSPRVRSDGVGGSNLLTLVICGRGVSLPPPRGAPSQRDWIGSRQLSGPMIGMTANSAGGDPKTAAVAGGGNWDRWTTKANADEFRDKVDRLGSVNGWRVEKRRIVDAIHAAMPPGTRWPRVVVSADAIELIEVPAPSIAHRVVAISNCDSNKTVAYRWDMGATRGFAYYGVTVYADPVAGKSR